MASCGIESDGIESDGIESDGIESDGIESDGIVMALPRHALASHFIDVMPFAVFVLFSHLTFSQRQYDPSWSLLIKNQKY